MIQLRVCRIDQEARAADRPGMEAGRDVDVVDLRQVRRQDVDHHLLQVELVEAFHPL